MRTACLVVLALGLTGCANNDLPNYTPFGVARAPKSDKFDPPIISGTEREHSVIGESRFATSKGMRKISAALKTLARQHGADAIILLAGAEENRQVQYNVPPSVEYH